MKVKIKDSVLNFKNGDFRTNAISLFELLGYNTDRQAPLESKTFAGFLEFVDSSGKTINQDKALCIEWKYIDLLFQITKEEISQSIGMFDNKRVDNKIIESYLFFAIELEKENYSRTALSNITREINKLFAMPALILFKYKDKISLSVINRRLHKKDDSKDVLEKVTIIKDINLHNPHRAHIDIIEDLSLAALKKNFKVSNFVELHEAWSKVLDLKTLNKKFYKELSAWYYYAIAHIKLPTKPDYYKDDKENVKNFTIRLINRLIFCWFLKEKGLINKNLLELYDYQDNLICLVENNNQSTFLKQNSYYRAILQNIFFASINTPHADRKKDRFFGKKYLSDNFDYKVFDLIPYLNGGLFDKLEEDNCNDIIEDSKISVPNKLFYGKDICWIEKVYDKKTKKTKDVERTTDGINVILNTYKFTIEENTPLEEDVALDPELLGMVFENLLAEVDPDEAVSKNAKKESGSFYTPRNVIDFMVNESMLLYFKTYFEGINNINNYVVDKLTKLIYFNEIDKDEKVFCSHIVDAIDHIRVIDPACGSGAFPMGVLHRIVSLLSIVDENNEIWIEKQVNRLPQEIRTKVRTELESYKYTNYPRKIGLIRNSIYGIDIQPMAVMITKLRFFISLLIEQKIDINSPELNYKISPLPNIETKIICANSLKDLKPNLFDSHILDEIENARTRYYNPEITLKDKDKIAEEIAEKLSVLYPNFAETTTGIKYKDSETRKVLNSKIIKEWFKHSIVSAPFFDLDAFFPELKGSGFDIVIGNPPYGGTDITDDVKTTLELGSKDPYGAFIARFLSNGERETPLKNKGVLAYIVSDTFMTIKSHKQLRQQMIKNYIHKMIRVHPDTFKATVNTAVIITQRNADRVLKSNTENDTILAPIPDEHYCLMADMTNVSIHENYDRFLEILYQTQGFDKKDNFSSPEYAIYNYPQNLIKTCSNIPFFVASPKLFAFMNDSEGVKKEKIIIADKELMARVIELNGKKIKIVKLEQIADVKHGMTTGDNYTYLAKDENARGSYNIINKALLLNFEECQTLSTDEKMNGFNDKKFNRRYFVPYDKGGASDTNDGWLPNYYVPTEYYIDWRKQSVDEMKLLTGHRHDNPSYYFKTGITFSITGVYAPTFRFSSGGIFDVKGSFIDSLVDISFFLGIVASKLSKYFSKCLIYHSVDMQVDAIKEIPNVLDYIHQSEIKKLVNKIKQKQDSNPRYDYANNEQIEIDRLVYEAYGLNEEDIQEVENWYARRYPKLVEAQRRRAGNEL